MPEPIKLYLKSIERELMAGNATEHTHRPVLKALLESLAKVQATNEPKRIECGAPDFVISRIPDGFSIGYLESKDVGISLDECEKTDQLKRYLRALPNLILTDYLEFRWFINGEPRSSGSLARVGKGGKLIPDKHGEESVAALLHEFLTHEPEPIVSPESLARRMASQTHMIRDIIINAFENAKASTGLRDLRKAFAEVLIPDLEKPENTAQFADMYSQTIAYGLFAARCNHSGQGKFKRLGAASEIPKTNPFLRKLFDLITGADLDSEPYAGFVDDLVQTLAFTDMESILEHFGRRTRQEDPVVHFYETFLAAYDPKLRESRGVYYTPEPVVSYIVRSVDYLLKTSFGFKDGLADQSMISISRDDPEVGKVEEHWPKVLILDPACGTGTFLYSVVDHIRQQFINSGNAGMWSGFVKEQLLPRLFGFELLMAPYAVAHFKLGMQLAAHDLEDSLRKKWAYDFSGNERLQVFLTNTLEEVEQKVGQLYGPLRVITEEAEAASKAKTQLPIMVIIGNPPYSGHSANASWRLNAEGKKLPTFIGNLMQDYYFVDGKPLGEKNPKWLQDDYVKFLRWAQWRIEKTGAGILAFITNHGYLDNPTFRGMRQQLMKTFDDIYVIDLHGNAKKKETCPDGSKDENVFDIQQGVAIGIFVKMPSSAKAKTINYAQLYGLRKDKYHWLLENSIESTDWQELRPQAPFHFMVPFNVNLLEEYETGYKITEVMPVNSVGIATARDELTIKWSAQEVWDLINSFIKLPIEEAREKYELGKDARDWKVAFAQEDLKRSGIDKKKIVRVLYRPFDLRFTYFTGHSRGFICMPRPEVMRHILNGENLALITSRMTKGEEFAHIQITKNISEVICMSGKTSNNGFIFPIYLYPDPAKPLGEKRDWPAGKNGRQPNLDKKFMAEFSKKLGLEFVPDGKGDLKKNFGPEDLFDYIYAVFHSPEYRKRYAEFLKIDFPRVPFISDKELFGKLCEFGRELVGLHLLEPGAASSAPTIDIKYPVPGENKVEKGFPKYLEPGEIALDGKGELKQGRVYVNKEQYFEGIPKEVWEFFIGGYQVCEKWLKDRRGRELSHEDLEHYRKIVLSLSETIRIMAAIDKVIDAHGGWPIK